jgi:hypothetical protein
MKSGEQRREDGFEPIEVETKRLVAFYFPILCSGGCRGAAQLPWCVLVSGLGLDLDLIDEFVDSHVEGA